MQSWRGEVDNDYEDFGDVPLLPTTYINERLSNNFPTLDHSTVVISALDGKYKNPHIISLEKPPHGVTV